MLSAYCCGCCVWTMERFRAGETPELLTWSPLLEVSLPHGRVDRQSVSEFAMREPEPVLPSGPSAAAPAKVLLSACMSVEVKRCPEMCRLFCVPLDREPSLPVKPNPPIGLLFHILLPHAEACDERSLSLLLAVSKMPVVKSRDRVCGILLVCLSNAVERTVHTLPAMAAMLQRGRAG